MAFVYLPNGAIMRKWKPEGEGANYQLSPTLQSLAKHKADLQVILDSLIENHGEIFAEGPLPRLIRSVASVL